MHRQRYSCGLLAFAACAGLGAPLCAQVIDVNGTIKYTGRSGAENAAGVYATFFSRGVKVELWDKNVGGPDVLIDTTWTADDGTYSFASASGVETDPAPGDASPWADPYIKIIASTRPQLPTAGGLKSAFNFRRPPGTVAQENGGNAGGIYFFDTPEAQNAQGFANIDHTFGQNGDTDRAFSAFDGMLAASRYAGTLPGWTNHTVDSIYPTLQSTSNFSAGNMHILAGDRYDWDVNNHEFGHYVQSRLNLANSPGGPHSSLKNLRFSRAAGGSDGGNTLNRRSADRLAFGEGTATYFGLLAQAKTNAAVLGVQRAGDTIYHDNDDTDAITQGLRYGIEDRATGNRPARGEDNEASVARILWDLQDSTNDAADNDTVSLGDEFVHQKWVAATDKTLNGFWDALIITANNQEKVAYGSIFQAHNAASTPTGPGNLSAHANNGPAPNFTWSVPDGGDQVFNIRLFHDFKVKIMDAAFGNLFESDWLGNVTNWTPAAGDWDTIKAAQGLKRWVVISREKTTEAADFTMPGGANFDYETGDYWGSARLFNVVPAPGVLALVGLGVLAASRRKR